MIIFLTNYDSLRSQLLGAFGRSGAKWPNRVRICFYLAKPEIGNRKLFLTIKITIKIELYEF
jgi:hypothetical protein